MFSSNHGVYFFWAFRFRGGFCKNPFSYKKLGFWYSKTLNKLCLPKNLFWQVHVKTSSLQRNVIEMSQKSYKTLKPSFALKKFLYMSQSIQPKTFPWFNQVPQSRFEANRPRGLWVMIRYTNKQTKWDYLFIYIYLSF